MFLLVEISVLGFNGILVFYVAFIPVHGDV